MPYVIISGLAEAVVEDPFSQDAVDDPEIFASLHGLFSEESCLEGIDLRKLNGAVTGGGRLRFVFHEPSGELRITTSFDVSRDLSAAERAVLIEEVISQWSDGAGSGSFMNHQGEVLSTTLAMAIRNAHGEDAEIGEIFVNAYPMSIEQNVQLKFFPRGSADDELIADLRRAADDGDAAAMIMLAQKLEKGDGIPQDDAAAFELFHEAADGGHPYALVVAGRRLQLGEGCEKDLARAIEYFRKAADQDFPLGLHCLGECYLNGEGVPKDEARGLSLLQRGADMDDSGCLAELGDCYENGRGTAVDLKKALALYQRALDLGFDAVEEAIERTKKKMG
jgi:hypothetical protein